ncbi:4Fe-4S dicluster domain-containing protein [Thiolapillus sp.]
MNRRRRFLGQLFGVAAVLAASSHFPGGTALARGLQRYSTRFLRPPGALAEADFLARCIRCGRCAEVCPNSCIRYFDLEIGFSAMGTPYIIPREQACILCMKCGDICPTGAIQPVKRELDDVLAKVHMGHARVEKQLCLSYQGQSCGVCFRACPLQGTAMRVGYLEQPHVLDGCVGCGLCERSCIQMPQAIRIIPFWG